MRVLILALAGALCAPAAAAAALDGERTGWFEGSLGDGDGGIELQIARNGRVDFNISAPLRCDSRKKRNWAVKTEPSDRFRLSDRGHLRIKTSYDIPRRGRRPAEHHVLSVRLFVHDALFSATVRDDVVFKDRRNRAADRCTTGTLRGGGERMST